MLLFCAYGWTGVCQHACSEAIGRPMLAQLRPGGGGGGVAGGSRCSWRVRAHPAHCRMLVSCAGALAAGVGVCGRALHAPAQVPWALRKPKLASPACVCLRYINLRLVVRVLC